MMKWLKSKSVEPSSEPMTVERVRADKPDLSDETAQALVDFVEHVTAVNAARRGLPLRTRFGLWWSNDAYPPLRLLFKGTLLVLGWFTVFEWIGGGQGVLDYVLRIGWILIGLATAGIAMSSEDE